MATDQYKNLLDPKLSKPSTDTSALLNPALSQTQSGLLDPSLSARKPDPTDYVTPPATMTQGENLLSRGLDLLQRPLSVLPNVAFAVGTGDWGDVWPAIRESFTGERPRSSRDLAQWAFDRMGVENEAIGTTLLNTLAGTGLNLISNVAPPDTREFIREHRDTLVQPVAAEAKERIESTPVLGSTWVGGLGLYGDIKGDPINYLTFGLLNRAGTAAQQAGVLPSLRSTQAAEGLRDLVAVGGRGLSSLPGRAGEAARVGQAAVFRAAERAGERALEVPAVRATANLLSPLGTGPVRAVRERLRQREAELSYESRRAAKKYGKQRREIIDIANEYNLDPEELNRSITREAQQRVRQVEIDVPSSQGEAVRTETGDVVDVEGIQPSPPSASREIQPSSRGDVTRPRAPEQETPTGALGEESYVGSGLEASVVEAPTVKYTVGEGETLSEIAERFGTTVQRLAEDNNIPNPDRINFGDTIRVPMPAEARRILGEIREAQPRRLAIEREAGVRTPEFSSERVAYLHRELTPEARKLVRKKKGMGYSWLAENRPVLTLRHGAQKARTIDPDAYIHEVNQAALEGRTKKVWIDEDGNIVPKDTEGAREQIVITDKPQPKPAMKRIEWFSEDPSIIEFARQSMTDRSVTAARALDDIAKRGTEEGWAYRIDPSLSPDEQKELARGYLENGFRTVQAPRFGDKLEGLYFPKEVAKEIEKFIELFQPKNRNALAEGVKSALRWWRNQTLFAIPSYHARNLGTGIVKNYYAGLMPGDEAYRLGGLFALYRQADNLAPRMRVADQFQDALGQVQSATIRTKGGKTYTLDEIGDLYEAHRLGQGYFEGQFTDQALTASETIRGRGFDWRRVNPLSGDSYYIAAGRAAGTFIEDNLRGALFIKKLVDGFSPEDAANAVRQYHFDYSDIPDWMKTAREYATPFITWAYKNLPNELHTLITQPGKYSRLVSTARTAEAGVEGERPTEAERDKFLLLPLFTGRDEQGNPRYSNISSYWGAQDLANISQGWEEAANYLLNQLHGYYTEIISQAQNQDTFTGQDIVPEELRVPGAEVTSEPFGLHPRLQSALELWRPYQIISDWFDPQSEGVGENLTDLLTGLRTTTVNPYFRGPAYFSNVQDAMDYYRQEVSSLWARAAEEAARGNQRGAILLQRQAQRWLDAAMQSMPQMFEELPEF